MHAESFKIDPENPRKLLLILKFEGAQFETSKVVERRLENWPLKMYLKLVQFWLCISDSAVWDRINSVSTRPGANKNHLFDFHVTSMYFIARLHVKFTYNFKYIMLHINKSMFYLNSPNKL